MTLKEINTAYNRIVGSLDARELKTAFDSMQSLLSGSHEYSFQDKLDELQETYKNMLRYRSNGIKDPMQESIYNLLVTSTYELADRLKNKLLTMESPMQYYSKRRYLQTQAVTLESLLTRLRKLAEGDQALNEEAVANLFHWIWTSDALTTAEAAEIHNLLSDKMSYSASCQVVSALLLGLLAAFDKEKLLLLFHATSHHSEEVSVRAMIGILLTLYVYRKRTSLYPQIAGHLAVIGERPGFLKEVRTITLRFILSRETEKITRKLQDEILPEMMKLSPKLSKKINLKDLTPDMIGDEMNPEWQSALTEGNLGKKMVEFSELQQEGADVMHSTFVHLKQFPFFHELSCWLLPFTSRHSLFGNHFAQGTGEKRMLDSMAMAPFMCNSDKYSLFFSMMKLPEAARNMMMNQFDSQASAMMEQNKEELISKQNKADVIIGQYIQDLYRFYKLYPGHLDFEDIFTLPLDFHNLPILQPYVADEETLIMIAEYYLRKNYFDEALTIYTRLVITDQESDILYQKIGYCKQMKDDVQGALEAYLRADLLNTESKWVIRRIAGCYRTLKQPDKALAYFHRYESLSPDNLSVQISVGHCHLELKEYSEALRYYFKVDYLDAESHKAWRPIAWCSFLTGKYDQAQNYYKKILDNQPNMQDLLNAGHTEWALQNLKKALAYYKQAVLIESSDFYKFQEQFQQDIPDLITAGIEQEELPLMLDQLRYALDNSL